MGVKKILVIFIDIFGGGLVGRRDVIWSKFCMRLLVLLAYLGETTLEEGGREK